MGSAKKESQVEPGSLGSLDLFVSFLVFVGGALDMYSLVFEVLETTNEMKSSHPSF